MITRNPLERARLREEIRHKRALATMRTARSRGRVGRVYCEACGFPCAEADPDRFGHKPPSTCSTTCADKCLTPEHRKAGSYGLGDRVRPAGPGT